MPNKTRTYLLHLGLFIATVITTTLAGAEWMYGNLFFFGDKPLGWTELFQGLHFSLPFLAVLTIHEFGHYFMAKRHQVEVTLPYYIPFWFLISQTIGTLGAFIKIKSYVDTRNKFFDIGIAGPLAGFCGAIVLLWYGFTHLPSPDHIFTIHPDYAIHGHNYAEHVYANASGNIALGDNLLFWFFKTYVADPTLLPHAFEIIHYPYLFAGYLTLFFTALNLLPIGQLDGGHILYGLIGGKHYNKVSAVLFVGFATYTGLGLFKASDFSVTSDSQFYYTLLYLALYIYFLFICFRKLSENNSTPIIIALGVVVVQFLISYLQPEWEGYSGFLAFVFVIGRFLGVHHPTSDESEPLGLTRKILGILALLIFVISFSPKPFEIL